jgi:molybdenum cofactor guanylyltransferase
MRSAGFVLAGGQSTRMQRDKALLSRNGMPLIVFVAQQLSGIASPISILGSPDRYGHLGFPVIADRRQNCGPMAGIEAALLSAQATDWNLIVACDLASVSTEHLRMLVAAPGGAAVALSDARGQIQPLCALYSRSCLPEVQRRLDAGDYRMMSLFDALEGSVIPIADDLVNVNTPEEWARCQTK